MRLTLTCGCKYSRSVKGSFMIKSCPVHVASYIIDRLSSEELEYIGLSDNDISQVEKISKSRQIPSTYPESIPQTRNKSTEQESRSIV